MDNPTPSKSADTPAETIIVTDICRQKAFPVSYLPLDIVGSIRLLMAIFTVLLAIATIFCAWRAKRKNASDCPGAQFRHKAIIGVATLCLFSMWLCFFIFFIITIRYKFYCQTAPDWDDWTHDWLLASLLIGPFLLLALLDWLYLLIKTPTNNAPRKEEIGRPASYFFLSTVLAILAIAPYAIYDAVGLLRTLICKLGGQPQASFSSKLLNLFRLWLRDMRGRSSSESHEIELGEVAGSQDQRQRVTVDTRVQQPPRVREQEIRPDDSVSMGIAPQTGSRVSDVNNPPPQYRREGSLAPSYHSCLPTDGFNYVSGRSGVREP